MKHDRMLMTPAALNAALSGNLENFFAAATPGGIEAQEKAGQTTFVRSATLPKDMNGCTREQFERLGFKFGPDADDIFVNVTMPDGWKKVATDHSMWSDLVDENGRKRAAIFYKAAFYDRRAHINLSRRFRVDAYVNAETTGQWRVVVKDGDAVIHEAGSYPERDYDRCGELEREALAWLKERHPNYNDVMAYWD